MNLRRALGRLCGCFLFAGHLACAEAQHSSAQVLEDGKRHLAIASAHTDAAQCLGDGKPAEVCLPILKASCAGLGIGKFCGLREDATSKAAQSLRQTAQAHQRMAQCIGSTKPYEECLWDLQSACKGLAIGKYCGLVHAHSF
jgi:hypothetical protein